MADLDLRRATRSSSRYSLTLKVASLCALIFLLEASVTSPITQELSVAKLHAKPAQSSRKKTKWERQAEQLERVRALRRAKRRAKRFRAKERQYRVASADERGALLRQLVKIDQERAIPLLTEALAQREDMTWRSDALRALGVATPGTLKVTALKSMLSPYVYERRALTETLIEWGRAEGEVGLRDLAIDKSVSVRRAAIQGLGKIGGAQDLLKSYALDGPDEGTSQVSARAWLASVREAVSEQRVQVGLQLLTASFSETRSIGVSALLKEGPATCGVVSEATLAQRGAEEALDALNQALWPHCTDHLLNRGVVGTDDLKLTLLRALTRWGTSGPKVSRFIGQHLADPNAELRSAVAGASDQVDPSHVRVKRLDQLRRDPEVSVRCAALDALIKTPPDDPREPPASALPAHLRVDLYQQLSAELKANIPTPKRDSAWLTCSLSAIERLKVADFDPLLIKAYHAWRQSIAYGLHRRKLVSAAAQSPGPARLEVLMEGMLDPDPKVKALAERALRPTTYRP